MPHSILRHWKFSFQLAIADLLVLACLSWAQPLPAQSVEQQQPPPSSSEKSQAAPKSDSAEGSAHPAEDIATKEQKISPAEAKELFQSVDQILRFASRDSGLPIGHPIKSKLTSRDEVVSYLEKNMREDKSAQRVYRSELVLKKFGLLPRDFHLEAAVVAMLREQVAGYYDPKTKAMNLLDWVPIDQQKPVLAHELTHALQDQSFNLEKWMKKGDVDLDKKKHITAADIEADEADEAREAVVEGQAEAIMLNYILAPVGRTVLNSPETLDALDADMLSGTPDSTEFKNAPIFLKESLTFPYRYGLKFVAALLQDGGKDKAFAGTFVNVPRTTRQIMEPKTYLSGERIDPMQIPDLNKTFKDYERFDVGAIGEFDVAMLTEQYAGIETSKKMYPSWRGGYYYSARPKGNPAASLGLVYVSRWSDSEKAAQFAAIYAKALAKRYRTVQEISQDKVGELGSVETLSGIHTWQTEEGPVVIAVQGDTVLVSESLQEKITEQMEHDAFNMTAAATK
ncbi:MAG: hypothetical protein JWO91_627 [Acidobacteriaceae bacterium]|nr:hypothetical protein [Acidobacteriaceae bacterium]